MGLRSSGDERCAVRVLGCVAVFLFAMTAAGGVARCAKRGPRYHTDDFKGERARGYAKSSDPMVWNDNQWRSTLFDGYARTYDRRYDQRVRPRPSAVKVDVRRERRVEIEIRNGAQADVEAKPRGPKHLNVRTRGEFRTNPGVLRFAGHDCRGILVLTWGALGSKSRCYDSGGRIKTPE
jgi:hypothetical protein